MVITRDRSRQWLPRISGDTIVWIDERTGNGDIFGYNLTQKKELHISTDPDNDDWPDISNGTVVYVTYQDQAFTSLEYWKFPSINE